MQTSRSGVHIKIHEPKKASKSLKKLRNNVTKQQNVTKWQSIC